MLRENAISRILGHKHSIIASSVVLLFLFIFSSIGQAQTLYGTLTGNVTDPSGAVVSGAKVELLNIEKGISQETTADTSGIYRFSAVLPGTYKVTITSPNFAKAIFEGVLVSVNTVRRVDAQLAVAKQQETVTVTGEAPILQTDKSDVHTDLTSTQIADLPITSSVGGRNFQALLRVVPGVGYLTEANSAAANPQRSMNSNINGQSTQGINTRIDGVQDAYAWLPANVAYVPPAEAVETVNVTTNAYTAEQGSAGGATVNVQIKSGTNQIHGSGFEFFNDHNLRTRDYFQTDLTRFPVKPKNIKQQFGGAVGGPIIKDKLFFFGDIQRTTQRGIGQTTATLPTTAMQGGDFSALVPAGTNCNTTAVNGCIWDPVNLNYFTGNIIPAGRIDPASAKLMALMPTLTTPGATTNNIVTNGAGSMNMTAFDVKINYAPTDKTNYFGRYSMIRGGILDPPQFGLLGGNATNGGQLGNATVKDQSIGLGGTHTFTPSLLMDWNIGYSRLHLAATALDVGTAYGLDTLQIPGTNGYGVPGDPSLYNGVPAFQLSGGNISTNLGNPNTGNPFVFRDNQWVANANLSWNRGKHAFRFGTEVNYQNMNHFQPQGSDGTFTTARGSFQFNGNVTINPVAQPGVSTQWDNVVAQLLLGLPNRAGKAFLMFNPVSLRWKQYAAYAQDQWQITPKLTLTLGLRWEFYPFGNSDGGRGLDVFNPADGNVYIGGLGSVPKNSGVDTGSGQFLPRVGFAYRLTPKTVLRAGYGMSADPNNYHFLRNAYPSTITVDPVGNSNATVAETSLTGTNGAALAGANVGNVGLTQILSTATIPNISTGVFPLPNGLGDRTWPRDFRRGYIQSFNLTVQHEIAGFSIEAGYVGSRAVRPLSNVNINSEQICPATLPGGLTRNAANCIAQGYGRLLNGNNVHTWSGISEMLPFGRNYYDSLQTKVTRKLPGASQIGFIYTYSKSVNFTENEDLSGLFEHAPALWKLDKAKASFDRPHNIQLYAIYELPFGKGKKWITDSIGNAIAGGWQLSGTMSRLSGTPFSVTANTNLLNPAGTDGLNNTANLGATLPYRTLNNTHPWSGSGNCGNASAPYYSCTYFDPAAFTVPAIGVLGNTHRNQFRGPGIFDLSMSLSRNFKLTERFTFQFRAEAFGVTNTPRFNNPNSGCNSSGNAGDSFFNTTTGQPLCSNFGAITSTMGTSGSGSSTNGARTIWFSGKIIF